MNGKINHINVYLSNFPHLNKESHLYLEIIYNFPSFEDTWLLCVINHRILHVQQEDIITCTMKLEWLQCMLIFILGNQTNPSLKRWATTMLMSWKKQFICLIRFSSHFFFTLHQAYGKLSEEHEIYLINWLFCDTLNNNKRITPKTITNLHKLTFYMITS